jgi:hypothetical protein
MTIGELAGALGTSVERILRCLHAAVRNDPVQASITWLAPRCTADELAVAEQRIGYSLPPLHRYVLTPLEWRYTAVCQLYGLFCRRRTART